MFLFKLLNKKPRVINSLAHRWTIDNFPHFYGDVWTIDEIRSNKFYSSPNKEHEFHLLLFPNGYKDEFRKNLSIYLYYSSPKKINVNILWKISIIDENGENRNIRGRRDLFYGYDGDGFSDYICISKLLDHSNRLLSKDTLTLLCEVQVIEDGDGQIEDNTSTIVEVSESHYNARPRVIYSLSHKWTIDNFSHFYGDVWTIDKIESNKFYSSPNNEHQFHLLLNPNGNRDEFRNNLSIYLYHSAPDSFEVNVRYKISIIDGKGDKCNTQGNRVMFCENENAWGLGNYISVSQLLDHSNRLLSDDKLTLLCEVQVIEDGDGQIEDNAYTIVEVSESHYNARPRVINSLAHRWTIDNFPHFYKDDWTWVDEIKSNKFNSSSNQKQKFHLILCSTGYRDEFGNNLSIYLYHSAPGNLEVNVIYKISIIDEKEEKCNTQGNRVMFCENENNQGFGNYISLSHLLDPSNGLLRDDTLTLLCEVIGDGGGQIEDKLSDNTSTIIEVSESHYNALPRVIDSLAHRWIIDNFSHFYKDVWTFGIIESDKFHSSSNKEHQFYLWLYSNGAYDENKNNLSIFLFYSSPGNVDVNVRCKISIIHKNGGKINSQGMQCIFNEKMNVHEFREYMSVSKLLDTSNGLLSNGQLTVFCEVLILDNVVQRSTTIFDSVELVRNFILELNQSQDSVHLSKCAHKWIIYNFACAFPEESSGDKLVSCIFPSSNSQDYNFYLSIIPKGHKEGSQNYASLHINVALLKKMKFLLQFKIFVVNANGYKLKFRELQSIDGEFTFEKQLSIYLYKFLSYEDLQQQLYKDNRLTLYCEIEVIKNSTQIFLPETKIDQYFSSLSKLELAEGEVTETVTNAKAKKIKFEFTWEIEICVETSETAISEQSSLFTSHPTSSHIESKPFSPLGNSTANRQRFYLQMYPNGEDEKSKDYVSIRLKADKCEVNQVTCQFEISLIEKPGFDLKIKSNTKKYGKRRLFGNQTIGFTEFISHSDLFNPANALIADNKLIVHCEIEFYDEEEIIYIQNNTNEVLNFIEHTNLQVIKPGPTLTPTNSITQVTLYTQHWTIDNFDLYFKSFQNIDRSNFLALPILYPTNNKPLQFFVKLYPKYEKDIILMCFDCASNKIQNKTIIVKISYYDANDEKCFAERFTADTWPKYLRSNWESIQVNPNFKNQLKLSVEYTVCTHYSSATEMSHLDQFTLDHFTSPWQVKRLCDVPTHSRALTSIPVESCHFEWSIHDFNIQQKRVKFRYFNFNENDQIKFYLRMNPQSQDKISIYLCPDNSVESEMKILVQIAILDKDGHKCCIRDGFVKMFEGELEYKCVEFENDNFMANGLGQDDTLRMSCELKLVGDATCTSQSVETIPKVLPQLNVLLTNRQKSDVILQFSDGNQLHAHRSILSARSPVFEKMFEHDTSEAQHGQVDITDMDMEVCELMLRYIYTGLVQLDQASTLDLMIAADKYQLCELKEKCEDRLCSNLTIESVTNCLVWSDQVGATKLKTKSIEFFHRNSITISQTNAIKEIIKNSPDLMQELYLDSTRHLNNQTETNLIVKEEREEEEEEGDISVL